MAKELKEITDTSNREGKHKEEYKGRMKSDLEDRMKIRKKLSGCINPLTETGDEFSDGIVNIATGKVTASSQTNVHNLKQIGDLQLKVFRASLPCGFHQPISSGVTTAAKKVKKLKSSDGNRETKDIGAIFNRLLLMSSVSDTPIDMKEVLKYELTPMPLSMFKTNGSPRICKAKSDFMNGLKVTVPTRGKTPDMTIVDGCAVHWKIQWPSANRTVQDFVKGFHKFVYDMLKKNDVMIIFDRYYDYSIKSVTRENRNTMTSVKDLEKFPPTVEAARLNIKRAHYQASIWTNLSLDIVPLDVEQFGWVKDSTNKTVDPVFLDSTTPIAPDSLLKVTFCGCCSQIPCSSLRCSCKQANVTCGELCKCKGECCNGSAPQEVHNDDLAVVDEVTTMEDSGDEDNDED